MSDVRIHELDEAPVFYPDDKEFADPLRYVDSIRPLAEHAGICKIIPPKGWKVPFCIDTKVIESHRRGNIFLSIWMLI
jgi:hypothetical protein